MADEAARRDQPPGVLRVHHAQQRLVVRQAHVGGVKHRLEVQHQTLVLQRVVHARIPVHTLSFCPCAGGVVAPARPAVLATLLGLVHRGVGASDQIVLRRRVHRIGGNAHAAAQAQRALGRDMPHRSDGVDQAHGQSAGVLAIEYRAHHRKLVTAQPCHQLTATYFTRQGVGHRLQHLVTGTVAAEVVDELEVVEVDEHQRQRVLFGVGELQGLVQCVEEAAAVGQLGQRVVEGLVRALFCLPLQRDVVVEPDAAAAARPAFDGLHALRDDAAVQRVQFQRRGRLAEAGVQHAAKRRVRGRVAALQQPRHDVAERQTGRHAVQRPDAREGVVGVDHAACGVDEENAVAHRAQQ